MSFAKQAYVIPECYTTTVNINRGRQNQYPEAVAMSASARLPMLIPYNIGGQHVCLYKLEKKKEIDPAATSLLAKPAEPIDP